MTKPKPRDRYCAAGMWVQIWNAVDLQHMCKRWYTSWSVALHLLRTGSSLLCKLLGYLPFCRVPVRRFQFRRIPVCRPIRKSHIWAIYGTYMPNISKYMAYMYNTFTHIIGPICSVCIMCCHILCWSIWTLLAYVTSLICHVTYMSHTCGIHDTYVYHICSVYATYMRQIWWTYMRLMSCPYMA